jgi:hypothetical protein
MSAAYSQRLTKNFVTGQTSSGDVTDVFLDSDFENWLSANSANVSKVGSLYIVKGAAVDVVLRGEGGFSILEHSGNDINSGVTLNDMGKEIRVGSASTSDYVVFRRVQVPGTISNEGGGGQVGYIVIDNNMSDLTRPRFRVTVARV